MNEKAAQLMMRGYHREREKTSKLRRLISSYLNANTKHRNKARREMVNYLRELDNEDAQTWSKLVEALDLKEKDKP